MVNTKGNAKLGQLKLRRKVNILQFQYNYFQVKDKCQM